MSTTRFWSYSAGERGRNRVRVFENRRSMLYVEFYEPGPGRCVRAKRQSLGHRDKNQAKRQADDIASRLGKHETVRSPDPTLKQLFDNYLAEVSAQTKGASKQAHDRRAAGMFARFFGSRCKARSLNIRNWNRFIVERREGRVGPKVDKLRPVGNRQIEYDLKFLLAVLNWATKAREQGEPLLERNPLHGLPLPREKNPKRPIWTDEEYTTLVSVATGIDWRLSVALVLAHETGHRIGAIRQLQWSDIDLDRKLVTWRAESDKAKLEHTTPLTDAAVQALRLALREQTAIGDSWVFVSPKFSDRPCSATTFSKWMRQAREAAGLGDRRGHGYHSFRRKFGTDLKDQGVALRDTMALGGWKDSKTLLDCYQHTDVESMRNALDRRPNPLTQSTHRDVAAKDGAS